MKKLEFYMTAGIAADMDNDPGFACEIADLQECLRAGSAAFGYVDSDGMLGVSCAFSCAITLPGLQEVYIEANFVHNISGGASIPCRRSIS